MSLNNVQNTDVLIGRAVLSVQTANKLGQVHDLIVDPTQGDFGSACQSGLLMKAISW
jgi:uncharacterized protein YrrD